MGRTFDACCLSLLQSSSLLNQPPAAPLFVPLALATCPLLCLLLQPALCSAMEGPLGWVL